jgi:hypothetical protein
MATYTWRTIVSTRREWIIPAAEPWGAFLGDLRAAIAAASVAYREACGLPESKSLPDDALQFRPRDEEIIISFVVEEAQQ